MKREIKFRAWDKVDKKWLLGYEYPNLGGFSMFGEVMLFGEWSSVVDKYVFERDGKKFDDLALMQDTGLKDKNGKEIYEGDVIERSYDSELQPYTEIGEVVYQTTFCAGFMLKYGDDFFDIEDGGFIIEVKGNIHENPELI